MGDDGFKDDGWYPHDGEGEINICPGPGCDCDERNYGYNVNLNRGKKASGTVIAVTFIVAAIVGAINSIIGAFILIGLCIYVATSK